MMMMTRGGSCKRCFPFRFHSKKISQNKIGYILPLFPLHSYFILAVGYVSVMWYTIRWICSVYGSVPVVLVYVYVNVPSVFWLCSVVFGRFCPCSGCVGCLFIDTILNEMYFVVNFFFLGRPRRSPGSRGEETKANEHSRPGETQSRGLLCCTSEI